MILGKPCRFVTTAVLVALLAVNALFSSGSSLCRNQAKIQRTFQIELQPPTEILFSRGAVRFISQILQPHGSCLVFAAVIPAHSTVAALSGSFQLWSAETPGFDRAVRCRSGRAPSLFL